MVSYYGQSDVGRQRKQNEDSILMSDRLFLVCDGMGGRKAGEVASRLAVETIQRETLNTSASERECDRLRIAIRRAHEDIRRLAKSSEEHAGMGTTVAALLLSRGRRRVTYANVGDSRIYVIRAGEISQLSKDDSWVKAAFGTESVDTAAFSSLQHVLTKALGTQDDLDLDVNDHELVAGDIFLLCSDGLTDMLTDCEILKIISKTGVNVESAGRELISSANAAGGRDNISAVLVHYSG